MSSKEIRAGSAFVELTIRDRLALGLRRGWARLKAFAGMVKAAFTAAVAGIAAVGAAVAAVVAPLVMVTKRFADVGSELHDMAGRTGVAVETLSEMKYAAEQTGASLSDVEMALRTMARKGIPVEKFEELAKSISAIEDPSERAAAAMQVFGKAGTKLLPMLRDWDALRTRAGELGLIITTEDAERADELGDAFDDLGATWDALKVKAGASFAGPMTRALEAMTVMLVALGRSMQYVAGAMAVMGAGFSALERKAKSSIWDLLPKLGIGGGVFAAARALGADPNARKAKSGGAGFTPQYNQLMNAVRGGSFGTFSSPGSSLAGRAGGGIKPDDGLDKKMVELLSKIGVTLDKQLTELNQGIDELEVGFQ